MGRSVQYPRNAKALTFTHLEYEADEDLAHLNWRDFESNLLEAVKQAFPVSWWGADEWQDEMRVVMKCDYAMFGYAEYCGLVSVFLLEAEHEDDEDATETLARGLFLAAAQEKLEEAVRNTTGTVLRKKGTFSNGEGVYEEVRA